MVLEQIPFIFTVQKQTNFDAYLTPYAKINWKWLRRLNLKA
jgi:hypothetical protein